MSDVGRTDHNASINESNRNKKKMIVIIIIFTHRSALRTPDHRAPVTGGIKRSDPIGGDAYGIPLNASTGSKWRPSKFTITPDTEPYFVCTTRDDNCTVSEPIPPKLFILFRADAFDVSPVLILFILVLLLLLLLLTLLTKAIDKNSNNIGLIVMNLLLCSLFAKPNTPNGTKNLPTFFFFFFQFVLFLYDAFRVCFFMRIVNEYFLFRGLMALVHNVIVIFMLYIFCERKGFCHSMLQHLFKPKYFILFATKLWPWI